MRWRAETKPRGQGRTHRLQEDGAGGQASTKCRENKHDPQTARGPRLGSGNDTISASFGGSGADFISIATAGGPASADPGPGRDKIRLNRNETKKIRNCETVYVFRDK